MIRPKRQKTARFITNDQINRINIDNPAHSFSQNYIDPEKIMTDSFL